MGESSRSTGIGFVGVLQVAFIVLKLCKVIDWGWWCVLLPVIISSGFAIVMLIICGILVVLDRRI